VNADLHQRAKQVFLSVRELEGESRRALLDQACAGDADLRREVESLLAHDQPETVIAPARHAVNPPADAPATPIPQLAASGSLKRLLWHRRRPLLAGLVAMVLLVAVGLWTLNRVTTSLRGMLEESFTTILDADIEAMEQWLASEKRFAGWWAGDVALREATQGLIAIAVDAKDMPSALLGSQPLADLRRSMDPVLETQGYRAFAIATRSGLLLATSEPRIDVELVGTYLASDGVAMVAQVFDEGPLIRMPHLLGSLATIETTVSEDRIMSVLTPIHDEAGSVIAALVFLMEPDKDFTRILSIARMGGSGDTYVFNADGLMLSHSRFEDEILDLHGIDRTDAGSMLRVRVVDPGGDMTTGHRPKTGMRSLPLSDMARSATAGNDGVNTDGYRDARGVEVVGAWRWLPEYGVGVATEVEKEDAYEAHDQVRTAFRVLFVVLGVSLAALVVTALVIGVMARKMQRLGQYTLVRKLGEGGMGAVYEARHAMLRRPVAVKLIRAGQVSAESLARFEREVQLTSQLNHPSTIGVYDYGRTDEGVFYYVMEHLSGISLKELIRMEGPLPAARVVHILRQVCGSLAEAHEQGLVHRDIKPANIMLCPLGGMHDVAKVLDFGIAKDVGVRDADISSPGMLIGTPLYMSPEAFGSSVTVDARSDLYALGAVAFELLTGEVVFPSGSASELMSRVATEAAQRPSERARRPVPHALDKLVLELLAKRPENRPASAREVGRRLDELADAEPWTEEHAAAWWTNRMGDRGGAV
jgi:hypothetical protein